MPNTVTIYDWFDEIQPMLIERLGIKPEEFRSYEGDDWRDYWHVFLTVWEDQVRNDSFGVLWTTDDDIVSHKYGPWAQPLVDAMNDIICDLEQNTDDRHIVVWFSW